MSPTLPPVAESSFVTTSCGALTMGTVAGVVAETAAPPVVGVPVPVTRLVTLPASTSA